MPALGWLVLTYGCTGTPAPPAEEQEAVEVMAPATARPMEIPTTPPMSGEPIAEGGARADAPAPAPGAPPADARDFQPVSIPEGPREGGGVRWKNVKTAEGNPVELDGGEVYDPNLAHD